MIQQSMSLRRRLRIVRWVALVDMVLLVALVTAALSGWREMVHILGPLHGINFLLLLTVVTTAALDGVWSWWFPLTVLLTAGAPGALIGEWILLRRLKELQPAIHDTRKEEQ